MAEEILELEVKSNVKGVTKEMDTLGSAIKDTTKEYKKLSDAVKESNSKTKSTTDLLSRQIENFRVFGVSIRTVKERMKLLGPVSTKVFSAIKTGVAATGIGAIVIAFGALFTWMTKSKVGAKVLAGVFEFLGKVVSSLTNLVVSVGDAVASLFGMRDTGALTAAEQLKKAYENIDTVMARIEERQAKNQIQLIDLKRIVDDVTKSEKERLEASSKAAGINELNNTEEIAAKQELLDLAKKELKSQQDFVKGSAKYGEHAATLNKKRGINIAKAEADVAKAEKLMAEAKTASHVAEIGQIDEIANIKSTNIKKNATAQTNAIAAAKTRRDNAANAEITIAKQLEKIKNELAYRELETVKEVEKAKLKTANDAAKKLIENSSASTETKTAALLLLEEKYQSDLAAIKKEATDLATEVQIEEDALLKEMQEENMLAAIENLKERALKELKIQKDKQLEELKDHENFVELKAEIDEKYLRDSKDLDKKKTDSAEISSGEQIAAFGNLAGALSSLAGENKELAAASAIIDTYVGANKAFAQGGVAGFATGAAIILAGLANVQKIYSTDVGDNGGGPPPVDIQPPAPEMMSGAFELSGGKPAEPMQAYVVSDDITANQNKLAIIRRRATI